MGTWIGTVKLMRSAQFSASVNRRRFRFSMNTSQRILAPSSVSTKPREDHSVDQGVVWTLTCKHFSGFSLTGLRRRLAAIKVRFHWRKINIMVQLALAVNILTALVRGKCEVSAASE